MAKPDWGALQKQFLADHAKSGISPKDWCDEQGLKFSSAKRYIKIAGYKTANSQKKQTANSQKKTLKKAANSQSKKQQKTEEKLFEKLALTIESEIPEDVFEPEMFGLNRQQGNFAEYVAKGKPLVEAYRLAEYECEGKYAHQSASRLYRNVKVQRAVRWLRDKNQKRLALTEREIIHQLSSIASIDANAFSQIRRVNCRYCWGEGHKYQWRDIEEQLQAEKRAEADNKAPPDVSGGIGFVEVMVPNDECPRCNGEGVMDTYYADTTQLDGPERWAYLGVEETMNGLKVKIASPEAARKELLAYLKATTGKQPAGGSGAAGGDREDDYDREWKRLRNEKIQAEIERIRTGDKESSLIVVHSALQVPGAIQPTQEDIDEGDE
ncbi:terminase small subunit [Enterobacter asburiae]|uniref:terminase small subunit n=1 Tax=Enterobacter asburiae TaxID=61645 RepID=UPI00287B354C|nr:terminase small subunit [Enterobacter asburiae]MDS1913325.1 terminase small subunit [Enterobacter asburiae]